MKRFLSVVVSGLLLLAGVLCPIMPNTANAANEAKYEYENPLPGVQIKKVETNAIDSLGEHLTLAALSAEGDMYTWGWQTYYKKDFDGEDLYYRKYTKSPECALSGVKDFRLIDGYESTTFMAITNSNELYLWGSSQIGLLKQNGDEYGFANYETPQKVLSGVSSFDNVYFGDTHECFIITDSSDLYEVSNCNSKKVISSVDRIKFSYDGSEYTIFAITKDNELYGTKTKTIIVGGKEMSQIATAVIDIFDYSNGKTAAITSDGNLYAITGSSYPRFEDEPISTDVDYAYGYVSAIIYGKKNGEMRYAEISDGEKVLDEAISGYPQGKGVYISKKSYSYGHEGYHGYFFIGNTLYFELQASDGSPLPPEIISNQIVSINKGGSAYKDSANSDSQDYALFSDKTIHRLTIKEMSGGRYGVDNKTVLENIVDYYYTGMDLDLFAVDTSGKLYCISSGPGAIVNGKNMDGTSPNEVETGVNRIWYGSSSSSDGYNPEIQLLFTDSNGELKILRNMQFDDYSDGTDVTIPSKPGKTSIKSIKGSKKALTVSFKKISKASGYQIQYSTNKSFKSKKTKNTTKTSIKISNLKSKKKYWVRVRAYDDSTGTRMYGEWCERIAAKTK